MHEATGFDKESINRSMKVSVPTMDPNTDFRQWKRNFLIFMSLKGAYLTPHLAIRESGVWLDEAAQTCALLLRVTIENKRTDQAAKYIYVARPDSAPLQLGTSHVSAWMSLVPTLHCHAQQPYTSIAPKPLTTTK
jgi:hypothetical protein